MTIDVPKSSLSVRPGTVVSIEDKIVLFAIACLIAPPLDKRLPETVYSWRVKKNADKKQLFDGNRLLEIPFLKKSTIQKHIEFVEPWYGAWPKFVKGMEDLFGEQGYQYLVLSDIVAYFENIDLNLLRDIMIRNLPQQPRIINFLVSFLEYWSWPAIHGAPSPRGIPQGNGVSSFLGNIYLLPLDQAFVNFGRRRDIQYLRYMDDVKVFTKDINTARDALFLMNEKLRELHLNIQAAKTHILKGEEIPNEIFDGRMDAVNDIIERIQKCGSLSLGERDRFNSELKTHLRKVRGKKKVVRDKELRLFRRLVTGFTLLRRDTMVYCVLEQLGRNPDTRLLDSAIRYFRYQDRNLNRIGKRLTEYLQKGVLLFPYQQAHCLMMLRYLRDLPESVWALARTKVGSSSTHWYVRQQAAILFEVPPI
jgi:hypothetical protein